MNKNSKVLSLKYRPQNFADLIGQDIVSDTIINSIKYNKVPNAYLFTGIRGVGKTTIARIIAKSLNCVNDLNNICTDKLCDNCKAISDSNHIDVLEMDAASKTGVDDVRDLIEFSRYGPTTAKYKIFIIDEVHMLSKQAFNALLKTLEEPPQYLKFIFATTEIKKIPITVISRCQRFDLTRVKFLELFEYIKKIKNQEKGKITDDAIKLIVKISEGSVRDALSLLDRALLSLEEGEEFDLNKAQNIFGYFDKSQLINLFQLIFHGKEKEVLKHYRLIYDQGIEPKIFLNDFLEILYYFKNINSLTIDGNNFSLNDEEHKLIKKLSNEVEPNTFLLFWQFAIKTLGELDLVNNQNLSIEMFLIRLIHLKKIKNDNTNIEGIKNKLEEKKIVLDGKPKIDNNDLFDLKNKTIGQIKNITQEKKLDEEISKNNDVKKLSVKSFSDLLQTCILKKEVKLKYELEKNVNLVSFDNKRIEISFNEKLDKEFIKILSSKLYEWTNERWIITLSKEKGSPSIKENLLQDKKNLFEKKKDSSIYKKILENFPDAEMTEVKILKEENNE
tara:strand:+ start:15212 stop:16888 length:1677 start_codon:yes stop_codon:yes gene_type:complete